MASLTIVVPAFNEEQAIGPVLDALKKLPLDAEILVVDDGSTDRTAEIAAVRGARVIRHAGNCGYGKSVKDAMLEASTDVIVLTDADGTYPIDRIPEIVAELQKGFDMVVGARYGAAYRGSMLKMPARQVFKLLAEFVTGRRIPDINSGLRAFRRTTAMRYMADLCNGFSFTTTITLIYMLTGKSVQYIPVFYDKRVGRSKVRMVRDTMRTLQYLTESIVRYNPLKLFLLLGSIVFLAGLITAWWMGPGAALLAFFSATIVFAIGLLAESLRRPRE